MNEYFYEKLFEAIVRKAGGKENLSQEGQQVIREAIGSAVAEFQEQSILFPQDPERISWVIEGKTMTYIKILSLKRDIPIVALRVIPVSTEPLKGTTTKDVRIALIQIGLSLPAYIKHDTRLGVLYELKNPMEVGKVILETLREKVSKDVKFVCLPECSFPSDETFTSELERFATERNVFIVAGSFHDLIRRSNTSLIITPYKEDLHKTRSGVLKNTERDWNQMSSVV